TGRIVIRAIKAFLDAGGKYGDIDKLKASATDLGFGLDPLGYMDGVACMDGGDADLTSEFLAEVLQLTHPDHHPPERKELAHRVTQGLLALQPFVFPALKPEKPEKDIEDIEDIDIKGVEKKPSEPAYPCGDCADAASYDYCDACRAEYEKREQQELEKRT